MTHNHATLRGYVTGRIDTPAGSENSLAFDARNLHLPEGIPITLELLIERPRQARCSMIEVRGGATTYGRLRPEPEPGRVRVSLNRAAIHDLREASGAFFYVDAVLIDELGGAQPLAAGAHTAVLSASSRPRVGAQFVDGAA
jgi:hypothetical protein